MLKQLLTIIFLGIIYTGCIVPTYTGKSSLYQTEVNKSDTKITSVLLVGAGSTASRLFLENFSVEMIKSFAGANIKCDFTYIGKIPRGSHVNLNEVYKPQYDAYLLLNPIDTSYVDKNKQVAFFAAPLPGGGARTGSTYGNQYKENYYIELYTNNLVTKIWQAELDVDFDFAKPDRYKIIAKQVLKKLLYNGYIEKK